MIFPHMRNHLSVTVRHEAMSTGPKFLASFDVIEQFAVEDYRNAAVFIKDWLLAVGQANDAQPPRSQAQSWPNQKPLLVRSTVQERPRHSLNTSLWHRTLSREIDHACDAAHPLSF